MLAQSLLCLLRREPIGRRAQCRIDLVRRQRVDLCYGLCMEQRMLYRLHVFPCAPQWAARHAGCCPLVNA